MLNIHNKSLVLALLAFAQLIIAIDYTIVFGRRPRHRPRLASPPTTCSGWSAATRSRSAASCCSAAGCPTCSAVAGCSPSASSVRSLRRWPAGSRTSPELLVGARARSRASAVRPGARRTVADRHSLHRGTRTQPGLLDLGRRRWQRDGARLVARRGADAIVRVAGRVLRQRAAGRCWCGRRGAADPDGCVRTEWPPVRRTRCGDCDGGDHVDRVRCWSRVRRPDGVV